MNALATTDLLETDLAGASRTMTHAVDRTRIAFEGLVDAYTALVADVGAATIVDAYHESIQLISGQERHLWQQNGPGLTLTGGCRNGRWNRLVNTLGPDLFAPHPTAHARIRAMARFGAGHLQAVAEAAATLAKEAAELDDNYSFQIKLSPYDCHALCPVRVSVVDIERLTLFDGEAAATCAIRRFRIWADALSALRAIVPTSDFPHYPADAPLVSYDFRASEGPLAAATYRLAASEPIKARSLRDATLLFMARCAVLGDRRFDPELTAAELAGLRVKSTLPAAPVAPFLFEAAR